MNPWPQTTPSNNAVLHRPAGIVAVAVKVDGYAAASFRQLLQKDMGEFAELDLFKLNFLQKTLQNKPSTNRKARAKSGGAYTAREQSETGDGTLWFDSDASMRFVT